MAGIRREKTDTTHTRSFTGCATCRGLHVKCDEGRPACSMCTYFGLPCAGYKKDIFFDAKVPEGRIRFRRPLLTEEERQRMSQWLVKTAPPKSTSRLLSQIDEEGQKAPPSRSVQLSLGPFGVFRVHQDDTPSPYDPLPVVNELDNASTECLSQEVNQILDTFSSDEGLPDLSPGFMQSLLEPPEDPSSASPDLLDIIMKQNHLADTQMLSSDGQVVPFVPEKHCYSPISHPSLLSAPTALHSIPQDAVLLLKHYSLTVISLMTPVRHKKTPCICAFYGTLAISAFSLGGVSRLQSWLDQGKSHLQQAQEYAKLTLMAAYETPKSAKYKSILMAILTMIQVSNFCGDRNEAEGYFLEAEKLIRMKGLKRRKSRKVRLLHHCYVFERMFHESIFVCGANSSQRRHVRRAIESSGLAPCSVDGLSFRLYKWKDLHREILRVRDQEEGENDLHLERPGLFSATLYPEIFGIPEPWVVLLSFVIRLETEKDDAEQQSAGDGLNLKDFIHRAKALEEYINQLQRPSQAAFAFANYQSSIDQRILENMLDAMRHGLAIYFYRRVYDLDASILQEKVVGVRDCLLQCEYADSSVVHGSAGFIWPAFIAACEAEDSKVQASFSVWFENSTQRSGLACFARTLTSVEKIWEEKRRSGSSVTWLDMVKRSASPTVSVIGNQLYHSGQ